MKIIEDHACDPFGQFLDQPETGCAQQVADASGHRRLVDGVGDSASLKHPGAGESNVNIHFNGLAGAALASVNADHCLQAEGTYEYDVQAYPVRQVRLKSARLNGRADNCHEATIGRITIGAPECPGG